MVQSSTHVQNSGMSNFWVYQSLGIIVIDLSNIRETAEVSIDEADSHGREYIELVHREFLVKEPVETLLMQRGMQFLSLHKHMPIPLQSFNY